MSTGHDCMVVCDADFLERHRTSQFGVTISIEGKPVAWQGVPTGYVDIPPGDLARTATVTVSSNEGGSNPAGLNDGVLSGYPDSSAAEWASSGKAVGTWARLTWAAPETISRVMLWDRPNLDDQVLVGILNFSDGSVIPVGALENDGARPADLIFPAKQVAWVEFDVTEVSSTTRNVGLMEFAAFK